MPVLGAGELAARVVETGCPCWCWVLAVCEVVLGAGCAPGRGFFAPWVL